MKNLHTSKSIVLICGRSYLWLYFTYDFFCTTSPTSLFIIWLHLPPLQLSQTFLCDLKWHEVMFMLPWGTYNWTNLIFYLKCLFNFLLRGSKSEASVHDEEIL